MTSEEGDFSDYPLSPIPTIEMWSENYAFMINDPANGVAMASQLGRWPINPSVWREFFMLSLPGERIAHHKAFGRAATDRIAAAALFSMEVVEPAQAFRLQFDGPVSVDTRAGLLERGIAAVPVTPLQFDLLFTGVAPVWDMSGHAQGAEAAAGKMHVEQVGAVSGTIALAGEEYRLEQVFGQRDHSRGIRVITNLYRHCWAQGWFPDEDLTFNVYMMALHGGAQPMANASISKAGRRLPATIRSLALMERDGDHARPYRLELESELGPMAFEVDTFIASMPAAFTSPYDKFPGILPKGHAASSNEEAVLWRWGDRLGAGWSERSFNAAPFPL